MDPPTLNANPVVHDVSNAPHQKRNALEWPELAAISANLNDKNTSPLDEFDSLNCRPQPPQTAEDMAILNALIDASCLSKGEGVSLLRNLGLSYPVDDTEKLAISKQQNCVPCLLPETLPARFLHNEEEKEEGMTSDQRDSIDADEIFDIIRNIQDPEHPLTLEQLGVVSPEQVTVVDRPNGPFSTVDVRFTPTIPHCSMATQIGLCLKVKLDRSLPRFKTTVRIEPGTHASEKAINKQLADKERVCAALENQHLLAIVDKCIRNGMTNQMD